MLNSPYAGPADRSVLTPPQQQVVELLAQGATVTAAAESVSIHRNTVSNWRRSAPSFRAALTGAIEEKALLRRAQIEALLPDALETIRATLADATVSPTVRLKAAIAILDRADVPPTPDLITAAKTLVTSSSKSEEVPNPDTTGCLRPSSTALSPNLRHPDPVQPSRPLVTLSFEPNSLHNLHNLHNPGPADPAPEPAHAPQPLVIPSSEPNSAHNPHNLHNPTPETDGTKPIPTVPASPRPANPALSPTPTVTRPTSKVGRNHACPCGSGKKYKRCCIDKSA